MFKTAFMEIMEFFKSSPWYYDITFIVSFLFALLGILFVLFLIFVLYVEVTKTVFTLNTGAIAFITYEGIKNRAFTADMICLIVLLTISFLILLLLIYCNEKYYGENIGFVILHSLFWGTIYIGTIYFMGIILILPLMFLLWNRNDRYSGPSNSGWSNWL